MSPSCPWAFLNVFLFSEDSFPHHQDLAASNPFCPLLNGVNFSGRHSHNPPTSFTNWNRFSRLLHSCLLGFLFTLFFFLMYDVKLDLSQKSKKRRELIDFREKERWGKTMSCCFTHLCIHWLSLLCAPTGGRTCNLGILEQSSN